MRPGRAVRRVLGPWFPAVCDAYRSIFVDLRKVAAALPEPPPNGHILDIGGGDGALINHLLARYPRVRVSVVDVIDDIGGSLKADVRGRVTLYPQTSMTDWRGEAPDLVLISDVIHHVPRSARLQFFADLRGVVGTRPTRIAIKEVEPGSPRAVLCRVACQYVTGDRHVALIRQHELIEFMVQAFPNLHFERTPLFAWDAPNYCIVFHTPGASSTDPADPPVRPVPGDRHLHDRAR